MQDNHPVVDSSQPFHVLHEFPAEGDDGLLHSALVAFSHCFRPALATEKELLSYATKLQRKAHRILLRQGVIRIGLAAVYANDRAHRNAFLPLFAVKPDWHGTKAAPALMESVKRVAIEAGMRSLVLRVRSDNLRALQFYKKNGFLPASSSDADVSRPISIEMIHPLAQK